MCFKKVKSKWINSKDNPTTEYFVEDKLNIWLYYCDILHDAHDKVADYVLNGYSDSDLNKTAIQKITGRIVFDSLASTSFLTNLKLQNELIDLISKSASKNESVKIF